MENLRSRHSKTRISKHGFTLVELLVVITVLAVLGTIGFASLTGYSSKSRDSARVTDVTQIVESLNLGALSSGGYPNPDELFTVTYSGAAVWYQGTVGDQVIRTLRAGVSGGGLATAPKDPLAKTGYAYSKLAFGSAYQIKADYENGPLASNWELVPETGAAGAAIARLKGTYGGIAAKTQTGGMVYMLAIPTILTNTGSAGQSIEISANILSGTLIFDGKPVFGASSYNPNQVTYSGASLPDSTSPEITTIATKIQQTYSGSDIANYGNIRDLVTSTGTRLTDLVSIVITKQLGGATSTPSATPRNRYVKVSVGPGFTCGLLSNGGIKCWGLNSSGQLGNGTTTNSSTPVDVVGLGGNAKDINTMPGATCAIMEDSTIKCWGKDPTTLGTTNNLAPTTVSGFSGVVAMDGYNFSSAGTAFCAVINTGKVRCIGKNLGGRMGDGTTTDTTVPVDVVGINSGAKLVFMSSYYACALMSDATVKCWGMYDGVTNTLATDMPEFASATSIAPLSYPTARLANGSVVNFSGAPVPLPPGISTGMTVVSGRLYARSGIASCGLTTSGGIKCWNGGNAYGEMGDGTTDSRVGATVDVQGISSGAAYVTTNGNTSCAILGSGDLKCWGSNQTGQLGDGTTINSSVPIDVPSP